MEHPFFNFRLLIDEFRMSHRGRADRKFHPLSTYALLLATSNEAAAYNFWAFRAPWPMGNPTMALAHEPPLVAHGGFTTSRSRTSSPVFSLSAKQASKWDEWRILLQLAKPDWLQMSAAFGLLFVAATLQSFLPALQSAALNSVLGISASTSGGLRAALLKLTLVGLVTSVIAAQRGRLFNICAARLSKRLRNKVFDALLRQPQAFHDEQGPGQLSSRLSSDCDKLGSVLSSDLSIALRNLVQSIVSITIILHINARLTGLVLLTAGLRAWSTQFFTKRYKKLATEQQDVLASSTGVAEQALSNIKLVRTHDGASTERKGYDQQLGRLLDLKTSQANLYGANIVVNNILERATTTGILALGSILVVSGILPREGLTYFISYADSVSTNLRAVVWQWSSTQIAFGAATRVFDYLKMPTHENTSAVVTTLPSPLSDAVQPSARHSNEIGQVKVAARRGELVFDAVDFVYPSRNESQVFDNLTLSVRAGERVAVVGESGCGKSTIFALALRLYPPSSGSILLDGVSLAHMGDHELRSLIAWVPQEPPLRPNMSVAENIAYGLNGVSTTKIKASAREASAYEFIQELPEGFDTLVGAAGVSFSGGQKQRIALARAFVRDPVLLLLDEPTSALDPESARAIEAAILRASERCTVIFTTHKLAQAQLADRIFMMSGGKVAEVGPHEELLRQNGVYAAFVQGFTNDKQTKDEHETLQEFSALHQEAQSNATMS